MDLFKIREELYSKVPLANVYGYCGCWLIRNKRLEGYIIWSENFEEMMSQLCYEFRIIK